MVRWNGQDRATSFLSSAQLRAVIPASDIASVGTASITVFDPAAGGGSSNNLSFQIIYPVPTVCCLDPISAIVGGPAFTLTIHGSGFVSGSVVRWNGTTRSTTFVTSNQIRASIPATDISAVGKSSVTVFNPTPGGGVSNNSNFTIVGAIPGAPTITSLNPPAVPAGGAGFTLTVNGNGFVSGSMVQINGQNRVTTFGTDTQLMAQILASDITVGFTNAITVTNPAAMVFSRTQSRLTRSRRARVSSRPSIPYLCS